MILKMLSFIPMIILLIQESLQSGCSKPAIKELKENLYYNVKLFDSPKKESSGGFCNQVWMEKGTCCNEKDAEQFTLNWLDTVKNNANSTRMVVPLFKRSLGYVDIVKKALVKDKAKIVSKNGMTQPEYDDFMLQLNSYIESIQFFQDRETAYNMTVEKCYANLYELRANMMCLRCSGDFEIFHNKAKNTVMVSEETCQMLISNCSSVFAYNAEIHTFFRRMQQIKSGLGGAVSGATTGGLKWAEINALKICDSDVFSCLRDEVLLSDTCWEISSANTNADIEGEIGVWIDGMKALRNLALGRDMKGSKRMLGEKFEFDDVIATLEKLDVQPPVKKEWDKNEDVFRIMASSGSSSSSSGKNKGIGRGHLSMVLRGGSNIYNDYKSESTIVSSFDIAGAIESNNMRRNGNIYGLTSILLITILLSFLSV